MRALKFQIEHPTMTGRVTTWRLTDERKPEQWEMFKSVQWLSNNLKCEPAALLLAQAQSRKEDEYTAIAVSLIPHILQWYNENPQSEEMKDNTAKAICWVLANYWHYYGNGPKPTGTKGVKHVRRTEQELFMESLHCGLCLKPMSLSHSNLRMSHSQLLKVFGIWMQRHSLVCQETISEKAALTKLRQEESRAALKNRKASDYYQALIKIGEPGREISKYLMQLRDDVERLTAQLKEIGEKTDDKEFFNKRYAEVIDRLTSRSAPSDLGDLNFSEKIELGGLYAQRDDLRTQLANSTTKAATHKLDMSLKKLGKRLSVLESKIEDSTSHRISHEPKLQWSKEEPVVKAEVKKTLVSELSPLAKADVRKMSKRLQNLNAELIKYEGTDEYTVILKAIKELELRIAQILR